MRVTSGRDRFGAGPRRNNIDMAARRFGARRLGQLAEFSVRRRRWVVAAWLLLAAVLTLAVPKLEQVVSTDSTPFLPSSSPSISAFERMDHDFGSGGGESISFVVLSAPDFGTNAADQAYYRGLVARLRAGEAHVADLQTYAGHPELRQAFISKDGDATYVPVAVRHPVGSPRADLDVAWIRQQVAADKPAAVTGYVTGDVASIADLNTSINNSITLVTLVTVVIIIAILLLLYRSLIVALVPLATIGIALTVARGLVALLGQSFLPVSTFTGTFVTALVLGAGTDYTVFLISRFHEAMRGGADPADSVVEAIRRIGPVVVASGFTVIIGSAAMVLAELALFSTTGPAIAVSVFVTLLVGLTLTPALLAILGNRVGPRPRRRASASRWAAVGALVARRPAQLLAASTVLLLVLAMFWPTLTPSYDTRALIPASMPSSEGYADLARHFAGRELDPDYVVVGADHDLRNSRDLAVLDEVANGLGKVPGVTAVRGVTRPQGSVIPQTQLPNQLHLVGHRLGAADRKLRAGGSGIERLDSGARQLSGGAARVSAGTSRAAGAIDRFLSGLARERHGLTGAVDATGRAQDGATSLHDGAEQLAAALRRARRRTGGAVRGLGQIYATLSADPTCTHIDQICNTARIYLGRIWRAERDQLLPGLAAAAEAADRIGTGDGSLADGLGRLRAGLHRARDGIDRLATGERVFRSKLSRLSTGASALAAGAAKLPPGVGRLDAATQRLAHGLARASSYLSNTAHAASSARVSAFYLPASALDDPRFALARDYYLSRDGRTARFLVFTRDASSRIAAERDATAAALRDTPLSNATISITGPTAVSDDIHQLADHDLRLVALLTLATVFLILVLLLRAFVAPLYLLGSVVLSYGAAMGVTALVWQDLLGRPIDFTTPLLAFVILVAVGADYNILLMSRVREESQRATRAGVARAVGATGGVITSAGLIFAGTFVAMLSSPVLGLKETGFAIAVGLMLDTFIVRSLLVPSAAALLGRANWWPGGQRVSGRDGADGAIEGSTAGTYDGASSERWRGSPDTGAGAGVVTGVIKTRPSRSPAVSASTGRDSK
jgi:RND superfamily putative drug exporter